MLARQLGVVEGWLLDRVVGGLGMLGFQPRILGFRVATMFGN